MAFKVIFDHYYKILCSYTYHFIRTPYAVDDIVQDIFVALWNRREKFDCIEKISSFLFVSARNACLNHAKHEQMKAEKLKEFVAQTDEAVYEIISLWPSSTRTTVGVPRNAANYRYVCFWDKTRNRQNL
ncbi:MAG: sigma factor [Butyricimonas faecihominis]